MKRNPIPGIGTKDSGTESHVWRAPSGEPLACVEKIKVLNQNLEEIREMAQEALEDAVLMGGDEAQFRDVLHALVEALENTYRRNKG